MHELKEMLERELKSFERGIAEETAKKVKAEAKIECLRDMACVLREALEVINKGGTDHA